MTAVRQKKNKKLLRYLKAKGCLKIRLPSQVVNVKFLTKSILVKFVSSKLYSKWTSVMTCRKKGNKNFQRNRPGGTYL